MLSSVMLQPESLFMISAKDIADYQVKNEQLYNVS